MLLVLWNQPYWYHSLNDESPLSTLFNDFDNVNLAMKDKNVKAYKIIIIMKLYTLKKIDFKTLGIFSTN